ncbi:hypothetical protein MKX03_026258, partial [Papaver bracteatum]
MIDSGFWCRRGSFCCKEYKLEDFISVYEIRRMKSLQMGHFETRRRKILGDNEYVKQTYITKVPGDYTEMGSLH